MDVGMSQHKITNSNFDFLNPFDRKTERKRGSLVLMGSVRNNYITKKCDIFVTKERMFTNLGLIQMKSYSTDVISWNHFASNPFKTGNNTIKRFVTIWMILVIIHNSGSQLLFVGDPQNILDEPPYCQSNR
jgi:hypothetical protein